MDLAKLVVRLEAQSAQLLTELEKANNKISKFERNVSVSLDRVNKKFERAGFGIKAALGTLLGAVSFKAVIDATSEAAQKMASLENAVERAGSAAGGRSAAEFAKVSREIANVTTQTAGAVQNVQQLLLRFQNIRTDRFDEATRRVLDLAQALHVDLDSASKTVGRALADPIKGVQALGKAGVVFSSQQKETIKNLVETGQRAAAQGLVLDELAKKFGGAAEAARNNFGGALTAVKNALGDLMEAEGGLPEATKSLNALAATLQDPAVKSGADALFSTLISGASKAAEVLGKTAAGVESILGKGKDRFEQLEKQIQFLREQRDFLSPVVNLGGKSDIFPQGGLDILFVGDIQKKIDELMKMQEAIQGLGIAGIETAKQLNAAKESGAFELPDIEVTDNTEALDKLRKKLEAAGEAMTKSLLTPYEKYTVQVAEADKLLAAHVITTETWFRALASARAELDEANKTLGTFRTFTQSAADEVRLLQEELKKINADDIDALQKSIDSTTDATGKNLDKALEEADKRINVFSEQAARNTQDILADGLINGFDGGIKGMLGSFADMLERMAAQAVAADIAGKIFGTDGGVSTSGSGGLFGQLLDWIGGIGGGGSGGSGGGGGSGISGIGGIMNLFASSMDSGGYARAGQPIAIGRGAQPELFVPDTPGTFYPNGSWSSGGGVTQNIYTTSPITQRSARQMELEAARQQRIATGRFG